MAGEALSNGTLLEVETAPGPPIVYAEIGGVESFTVPGFNNDEIEVTALDSAAREYIADLPDTGETTFTLMLRKSGSSPTGSFAAAQERLEDLAISREIVSFRVTFPAALTTKVVTCQGFVKNWQPQLQSRAAATAAVTIRWTGAPVIS